ncbi:MAG: glycosyltransferase family 39 protein [Candidatus Eremiobacteraeota bacterium]|nr:glycosyltransferase family 39 protein [Candidatus Eremiobacteraeota bacterium]
MTKIPLAAALLTLGIHLVANPHYGFFRDELYFIVCGFRPAWGYVDQPPLVPLLSAGTQLFGTSLFALRALPALFAAAGVYVTCLLAIEIGAGRFGVTFAALLTAVLPLLNAFGTKVSTDMPGLLFWPLIALLVTRIVNGGSPRLWIWAAIAFGIGSEAKYTMFFYGAAMLLGIALTAQRRILLSPWFPIAILIGSAIALPSLLWQVFHGWPFVEMIHAQQDREIVLYSPPAYVLQQAMLTNPILAPVWIAGLIYAFIEPKLRWIGWTYVLLIVAMIGLHGRNYYPGDIYPLLIAAGAVAIERSAALKRWRPAIVAVVVVASVLTIPFVYPVMAEARLAALIDAGQRKMPIDMAPARDDYSPITQNFADMHGWPQLTAAVAEVYDSLPPSQRARAAVLAGNYGEAAAIDVYGHRYDLPPAISGHNNYWIWGSRGYDGSIIVEVNGTCGAAFRSGRVLARFRNRWVMPTENGIPISICYGLREPLSQYWPHLQRYI